MNELFGTKELYNVTLKTTIPVRIGDLDLEAGEPVLMFDNIKLSAITQPVTPIFAKGGKGARPLMVWEDKNPVRFQLHEGKLTQMGLALLTNMKLIKNPQSGFLSIPTTYTLELDSTGKGELRHQPIAGLPFFAYKFDANTKGEKIGGATFEGKIIDFGITMADKSIMVSYYFYYDKDSLLYILEPSAFNLYLTLEGRFYTQKEHGVNNTNLLFMPQVKILSNLNLRLGDKANPLMSLFDIVSVPGETVNSKCSALEILALDEDIDGDI